MSDPTNCPACRATNVYTDGNIWICPDCAHEFSAGDEQPDTSIDSSVIKDAFGNTLQDGDQVTVIKDLKIKGSSSVVKVGTKVKNIRLVDSADGHNIACKIEGFGQMNLKSEFVKKA